MRLAVFTNEFPGRVSTFFARDMRGLLEAGIEIDVFPIYPLKPRLWRYVPALLSESVLPKSQVHHLALMQTLQRARPWPLGTFSTFLRDTAAISTAAVRFGVAPLAKSVYVFLKAWAWAQQYHDYDHILAYWGNYAATCAYIFHRLIDRQIPWSIFLHAGIDLFRTPVYMRQKLLYADNIITCSEFNRQYIRDHFADIWHLLSGKIHVHPHGLDFGEIPYKLDGRLSPIVIAVGRFTKYKGFDYLLHATHALKARGISMQVELVGDGPEAGELRALADKLDITERIRFRGWLASGEVWTAMQQAALLAHPSPCLGDGVPNVIKEAMAVGTPVIASNLAGIPELLDNARCGVLVPPGDVQALADAIERLLMDKTLRYKYATAAREHVQKKFDLWRNGQHLAQLFCATTRGQGPISVRDGVALEGKDVLGPSEVPTKGCWPIEKNRFKISSHSTDQ